MASGLLTDYLAHGNAADRPETPDLYVDGIGLWWNDDTATMDLWNGVEWLDDIASGGGGGGGASWGSITGTLSAQTDLTAALAAKANTSSLAAIATSGVVGDLQGFPGGTTNFLREDGTFAPPAGGGDVVGPATSVNDRIAVFDGTTGKLLKVGAQTIAQVIAAAQTPRVQAVTSAGTVTPTFANDLVKITAQAVALTLANPSGTAVDGHGIVIRVKDNGTARAITYGSQYRALGVTLPTTTTASKTTYLAGVWNVEDTTLDIVAVGTQA